ncbi:MFS transporter [Sulfobacillus thermosulfidooxidans]|uniref:MFS transporter n=1 Tax=Sulfobacillus thermosulfidooxidans TaxID=28034 RepID=UPI0006B5374B|nr:MFS transporter [Sulfobacillus thermosulfidooxidans]
MRKSLITRGSLSYPSFRQFFLARSILLLGNAMTPVALAFAVLEAPQGQRLLGDVLAVELLPHIVMLLIGGQFADRYRRQRILLWTTLGSGLSQLSIATIVLTGTNAEWILPWAMVKGILAAFSEPALRGIIPEMVDTPHLQQANALLSTSRGFARIIGPSAAGILVATWSGGWAILFNAFSSFLAALLITRIHLPERGKPTAMSVLHALHQGWEYFRKTPWIWSITVAWAFMNALQMGAWQVLGPIIAQRSFGSTGWGMVLSFRAIGLLIAGLVLTRVRVVRPLREAMLAAAVGGLPLIILGLGQGVLFLSATAMAAGLGLGISTTLWDSTLQQGVPRNKISRIMALDDMGAFVLIPLGEMASVPIAHQFGLYSVERVAGLLFLFIALAPITLHSVRTMTPHDIQRHVKQPLS